MELIVKYMKQVPTATKEAMFFAVKDKQAKNYYNTFLKPSKLAKYFILYTNIKFAINVHCFF